MRRDLPYNGLTRAQVLAIGADPEEVEAGRLAQNQWAAQRAAEQHRQHVAEVLEAAQMSVATGQATPAEIATLLWSHGEREAHAAFLAGWEQEEAELAAYEAADELSIADVEQYKRTMSALEADEREKAAAEVEMLKQQIAATQLKEITDRFNAFVQSTPGAHQAAEQIERQLVHKIRESGIPATPVEQDAMIAAALQETAVLGQATESLRQQVDQEWRLHRKASGARDGLMTQADIDRAEAAFKDARFKQLSDSTLVDLETLKPGPSAAEQEAALVEKYRERQTKSTELHQAVAGIAERGKDANATRDRGEGISEEKTRYREAMARAEAEAQFGSAEVKTGYAATHEATLEGAAKSEQQLDEYGGAFPGFQQG
jgi:hypothetical protein